MNLPKWFHQGEQTYLATACSSHASTCGSFTPNLLTKHSRLGTTTTRPSGPDNDIHITQLISSSNLTAMKAPYYSVTRIMFSQTLKVRYTGDISSCQQLHSKYPAMDHENYHSRHHKGYIEKSILYENSTKSPDSRTAVISYFYHQSLICTLESNMKYALSIMRHLVVPPR